MWRFIHFTESTLPLTFILGQTLQRRRFVSLKTHVSIRSNAQETKVQAGSIRQTLLLVTALSCFTLQMKEGLFTQEYLTHCKGKENLPPGSFNSNKWSTVWSVTINTDQRAQNGLLLHNAPCATTFFLARRSSHTHIQTHH